MILITGGAGFIGSNLAAALEARGGAAIVVCDTLGRGEKWRNLAKRGLADLVAPGALMAWLDGQPQKPEIIYHLGAISATTERDGDLVIANNFRFSLALWDWCARNDTRFIYASSAATYGDGAQGFDDDATTLADLRPLNLYGWSKHLFDRRVTAAAAAGGPCPPQWAGLKLFNVFGPNEYHKGAMKSVVAQIHPRAVAGGAARLFRSHHADYADGGQLRDFIWVDDCVDVMLWLAGHAAVSGLFNLGTGRARSFADLAAAVYGALDMPPAITYVDTPVAIRDRYQYFTEARMQRLRDAGYRRPFTSLEDGVRRYVQEYLSRPDPYR